MQHHSNPGSQLPNMKIKQYLSILGYDGMIKCTKVWNRNLSLKEAALMLLIHRNANSEGTMICDYFEEQGQRYGKEDFSSHNKFYSHFPLFEPPQWGWRITPGFQAPCSGGQMVAGHKPGTLCMLVKAPSFLDCHQGPICIFFFSVWFWFWATSGSA